MGFNMQKRITLPGIYTYACVCICNCLVVINDNMNILIITNLLPAPNNYHRWVKLLKL